MGAFSSTLRKKILNRHRKRKQDSTTDGHLDPDDIYDGHLHPDDIYDGHLHPDDIYATIDDSMAIGPRLSNDVDISQCSGHDARVDQHSIENSDSYTTRQEIQSIGSKHGTNGSNSSNDSAIGDISRLSYSSRDSIKNHTSSKNRNTRTTVNRRKRHADYLRSSTAACTSTRSRLDKLSGKRWNTVDGNDAWVDPSEHIQQMVEIYRTQLECSINAREVIPYMPYIVDDREAILTQESDSPRTAMSRLLDKIAQSEEKGKWTTFLDALKTVGYQYIANLLTGKTEGDNTNQICLLRILAPELTRRIDTTEFLDHLYQDDVISEMDKEGVECEKKTRGQTAANLRLIELMPRKLENWCQAFINTMRKCGMSDVADEFESSGVIETCDKFDITRCEETSTKTIYTEDTSDDDVENTYIHPIYGDATAVAFSEKYPRFPPLPPVPTELRTNGQVDIEGDATSVKISEKDPNLPPLPPVPIQLRRNKRVEIEGDATAVKCSETCTNILPIPPVPMEIRTIHPQHPIENANSMNNVESEPSVNIASLLAQMETNLERKFERLLTEKIDNLTIITESTDEDYNNREKNDGYDDPDEFYEHDVRTPHELYSMEEETHTYVNSMRNADEDSNNREADDVRTPEELHELYPVEEETYTYNYNIVYTDVDHTNNNKTLLDNADADMGLAEDRITEVLACDDGYEHPVGTVSNRDKCTLKELIKEEVDELKIHIAKEIETNLQPFMTILEKLKCLPVTHVQSDSSDNYIVIDRPSVHQKHLRHGESGLGNSCYTLDIDGVYI